MPRLLQSILIVAPIALLAACAGPQPATATDLPDDFALAVTVIPQRNGPPLMAPAWYVVEPDGVLHVALGERLVSSTFPAAVRTLSREEVRRLWELVVAGGLADPKADRILVPEAQAKARGAAAIVFVAASGRRRSFAVPLSQSQSVEPVLAELRRLGWVPEEHTAQP